mmetsp:Transcript_36722/g.53955  ORF Transcript_36722/g.53955 Transcript_36722/m.53955 type:complete len:563 (-) Transcript_36722:9-1697(-)|eukprot:CAMPEP_0195513442 /NCGR_PEP_ID=MMETSP0794_2-20130614/5085_1 /TAXON_ID=515487 /ORGANISM="Stephanopyxis turris, Strain CCMP 815" /LENGTH=562 /DNA_ID=CAMNT_0040641443 /DNA_START=838 /DNA_END=2526 /DNA_ORIENTATION=-
MPAGSEHPTPFLRPRRVRAIVLACSSTVIIFSVLLITKGLSAVEDTTTTLNDITKDVHRYMGKANHIANSIIFAEEITQDIRQNIVVDMKNFCPNHDLSTFFGEKEVQLLNLAKTLDNEAKNFVDGDLQTLKGVFDYVEQKAEQFSELLEWRAPLKYTPAFWIPLIFLSTMFIIGTILAWMELSPAKFRFMQSFVLVPVFYLMILVSFVFSSSISVVAVVNADACSGGEPPGSPEGTIMEFFDKSEMNKQKILRSALLYYIEGCVLDDPFLFISEYRDHMTGALSQLESLIRSIEYMGNPEELSELCGKDITPTIDSLGIVVTTLRDLIDVAKETIDLLSCENVLYPLYRRTFHEAGCTHSITGLSWILSSLVVITICGMTMITLRASWLHIDYSASFKGDSASNSVSTSNKNDGEREETPEDHESDRHNFVNGETPQDYEWYERNGVISGDSSRKDFPRPYANIGENEDAAEDRALGKYDMVNAEYGGIPEDYGCDNNSVDSEIVASAIRQIQNLSIEGAVFSTKFTMNHLGDTAETYTEDLENSKRLKNVYYDKMANRLT